jgi:hypothetical protein
MRTKTLLVLAVVCGMAILLAGGIQLWRIIDEPPATPDLAIGARGTAGDLYVTVQSAVEQDGLMRVELRLGGVDDPEGLQGFSLLVQGKVLEPLSADQAGGSACRTVTVTEQTCSLVFGTASVDGTLRVLRLRRGEDQQRWTLA